MQLQLKENVVENVVFSFWLADRIFAILKQ